MSERCVKCCKPFDGPGCYCQECDVAYYDAALRVLGITAEQLKIARALDREKVEALRILLSQGLTFSRTLDKTNLYGFRWADFLSWLPTFDTKGPDGI